MNLREQLERAAAAIDPPRSAAIGFHARRVALAVVLAGFTYALFPASPAVEFPVYEIGSVATDNVIAPFAYTVLKAPAELQQEREMAGRTIEPIFRASPAAADTAARFLAAFDTAVTRGAAAIPPASAPRAIQAAAQPFGVSLTIPEAQYLANPARREALIGTVDRLFTRWLHDGVAPGGALDGVRGSVVVLAGGEERRVAADSILTFSMLVSRARLIHPDPASPTGDALYMRLIGVFFRPTLIPDPTATELRREELRRAIPAEKYSVRAGEKVIGANEVVGREQHDKLRALKDGIEQTRDPERSARRVTGAVLFNFLLISLLGVTLLLFRPLVYANFRWVLMFALVAAVVIGGARIVALMDPARPELVPVALAAVLLSALFDQRISMIAAMVLATLIGGQSVFRGTNALFINLVGGAVGAFSVRAISRRNQLYQWILTIAGAYVATAIAIGLTLDLPLREIFTSGGYGVLNAFVSVLLALLLLPMAEAFVGVETDLTLLEWSDLNRPLMQRLSLEAPGTYAHTIAIANLAESAARAAGANALLTRVGAYYHDIGKLGRPQYFVENQPKGRNPHDRLKPGTSAQIIRNHVSEGLALAEQHKLPRALRAFITEHHGTGAISYFYEKAKEHDGGTPDPSEYAYPGPLPQSAETAIVMLADGVEAAARVLAEPTPNRIREVVNHIVKQRMDQGQLSAAPLTLQQIEIIKAQFARVLTGMYHARIDYPATSGGVTSEFAAP